MITLLVRCSCIQIDEKLIQLLVVWLLYSCDYCIIGIENIFQYFNYCICGFLRYLVIRIRQSIEIELQESQLILNTDDNFGLMVFNTSYIVCSLEENPGRGSA